MAYTRANANRNLARIERKAKARAEQVAEYIVEHIALFGPRDELHRLHTEGPHLADSYHVEQDPVTGDFLIRTSRPYWAYVEFGTRRREYTDRQPHVRPAIDAARAEFS